MKSYTPYAEKLKDPKWQKKRLQVLEHACWKCQLCGCADRQLQVHHSYYTKGKEPWQYPLGSLIAVCDSCHDVIHKTVKQRADYHVGQWKLMWISAIPEPEQIIPEKGLTPKDKFQALREQIARLNV